MYNRKNVPLFKEFFLDDESIFENKNSSRLSGNAFVVPKSESGSDQSKNMFLNSVTKTVMSLSNNAISNANTSSTEEYEDTYDNITLSDDDMSVIIVDS